MEHAHSRSRLDGLGAAGGGRLDHQLELHLDTDPFWMSSLRAVTTDLAMRADFDLDSALDLTLAVDEACTALVGVAAPRDTLVCSFEVGAEQITVTATLPAGWQPGERHPRTDGFGWLILTALTDNVELLDGEHAAGIRLVKRRAPDGT